MILCSHGDVVTSLKWHESQPVICTSSVDLNLRLWDARNGNCLQEFTGHKSMIIDFDMMKSVGGSVVSSSSSSSTSDVLPEAPDSENSVLPPVPGETTTPATNSTDTTIPATDVIVSASDDFTARVFHYNMNVLLKLSNV